MCSAIPTVEELVEDGILKHGRNLPTSISFYASPTRAGMGGMTPSEFHLAPSKSLCEQRYAEVLPAGHLEQLQSL